MNHKIRYLLTFTILCAATLPGCATGGNFCRIAEPIRPTPADVDLMSQQLVDALIAHNCEWQAVCGDIGLTCER